MYDMVYVGTLCFSKWRLCLILLLAEYVVDLCVVLGLVYCSLYAQMLNDR